MDGLAIYELGRILYEDRLRDAMQRDRMWDSNKFRSLPRLVQALLAVLS